MKKQKKKKPVYFKLVKKHLKFTAFEEEIGTTKTCYEALKKLL
jgi:hypothetical protein